MSISPGLILEWKQLNFLKKAFVVVQAVNGIGFAVMAFIVFFKLGINTSALVAALVMMLPCTLEILGSYYFLKGKKSGYVLLLIAQALFLVSFSWGDYEWELDNPISLSVWFNAGENKFRIDFLALIFLILIFRWLKISAKPKAPV